MIVKLIFLINFPIGAIGFYIFFSSLSFIFFHYYFCSRSSFYCILLSRVLILSLVSPHIHTDSHGLGNSPKYSVELSSQILSPPVGKSFEVLAQGISSYVIRVRQVTVMHLSIFKFTKFISIPIIQIPAF